MESARPTAEGRILLRKEELFLKLLVTESPDGQDWGEGVLAIQTCCQDWTNILEIECTECTPYSLLIFRRTSFLI